MAIVRIVQLANFATRRSGSLWTALHHLGEGYRAAGHERVLVVPGTTWREERAERDLRIEVPGRLVRGADPHLVITDIAAVAARLDSIDPDVLEISDTFTLHRLSGWARRRRVATVLVSHECFEVQLGSRFPRLVPRTRIADSFNRRLAARVDRIVCPSAYAAAEFVRIGANPILVPLGVDLDVFGSSRAGHERLDRPTVVWSGRMTRAERPDVAAATLRTLQDRGVGVRGLMVGAGPMRPQLEAMLTGYDVQLTGLVDDRRQLAAILATSDVALCTAPTETFGFAALEAMASATPVVVPNRGGTSELVADGAGVATYFHPEALASAVTDVLSWPVDQRRATARARAEEFPWSRSVEAMLAVHRDVVESAVRRRALVP